MGLFDTLKEEKAEEKEEKKIELSSEQQAALEAIDDGQNVFITGSAGTGKSELVKALRRRYPSIPVTASTGIAGVAVGGLTLHSWAGIGLGQDPAEKIIAKLYHSRERSPAYDRIVRASRLVIDEISMISGPVLSLIDQVLRGVRLRPDDSFGGIQIIATGDFCQLPPIQDHTQTEDGRFAFESRAWEWADIRTIELTHIFRQSQRNFIQALQEARMGQLSRESLLTLQSRFRAEDPDPTKPPVRLYTHNVDVDDLNNLKLAEIDSPEKIYTAKDTGTDGGSTSQSALKMLEKNCPAGATVRLKAGARVMLLKNLDVERGLANGTMGTVRSLSHGVPIVQFDDIEDYSLDTGVAGSTRVDFATWEVETGGVVLAKRSQIPLRLAYALSVHKSQGQSLSKVAVSLDRAFEPGQSYVAISRARTLEGLYITDGGRHSIFAHPDAVAFYEGIRRAQSTSADRG